MVVLAFLEAGLAVESVEVGEDLACSCRCSGRIVLAHWDHIDRPFRIYLLAFRDQTNLWRRLRGS